MLLRQALVLTEILLITSHAVGQFNFGLQGTSPVGFFGLGATGPLQLGTQFNLSNFVPSLAYAPKFDVEYVPSVNNILVHDSSWPAVTNQLYVGGAHHANPFMTFANTMQHMSQTMQRMTQAEPTLNIQTLGSNTQGSTLSVNSQGNSLSVNVNYNQPRSALSTVITFPAPPAYLFGRPFRFVKVTLQDQLPVVPRPENVRYFTFDSPLMRDYAVQYIRIEPVAFIPPRHDTSADVYYVTFVVMGDPAFIPRYHFFRISLHIGHSLPNTVLLALPPAQHRPPKLYLRMEALAEEPSPQERQNVNVPILYLKLDAMWTNLKLPEFWIKPMRFPANTMGLHESHFRYVMLTLQLLPPRTPPSDNIRFIELAESISRDPAVSFLKIVPVPVINEHDVEPDVQYMSVEVPEEYAPSGVPNFLYFRIVPVRSLPTSKEPNAQYLQLPGPARLFLRIEALNKLPQVEFIRYQVVILKLKVQVPRGPKVWLTAISFPPNAVSNGLDVNRYLRASLHEIPSNEPKCCSVRFIAFSSPLLQDPNVQYIEIEPVPELGRHNGEPDVHFLKVKTPDDEEFDNNPRYQYFRLVPTHGATQPNALYLNLPPVEDTPRPPVLYVKIEALDHKPPPPTYPYLNVAVLELAPVATLPLKCAKRLRFPPQKKQHPEDVRRYLKATLLSLPPREPKSYSIRFFSFTRPLLQHPLFEAIEIEPIPRLEVCDNEPGVHFLKVKMPDDAEFDNSPRYHNFRVAPHTGPRQPNARYIYLPPLGHRPPALYLRIEAVNDEPANFNDPSWDSAVLSISPAPHLPVNLKPIRFPLSKSIKAGTPRRYLKASLQDYAPIIQDQLNEGYLPFATHILQNSPIPNLRIETLPSIDKTAHDPLAHYLKVETPDEEEFDDSPRFSYLKVAPNYGLSKPNVKYLSLPLNESNAPTTYVKIEALDDEPEELGDPLSPSNSFAILAVEPVETKAPQPKRSPKYIRFPPNQSMNLHNPNRYIRATIEETPSMDPKTDSVRYLRFLMPEDAAMRHLQITPVLDIDEDEPDMNVHLLRVERPEDTEFEDSPPYSYFRFGPDVGSSQPTTANLPTPQASLFEKKPFYVRVEALADEPTDPRPNEAILPVKPAPTVSAINKAKKIRFPPNIEKQPPNPVRYIQVDTQLRPPREPKTPYVHVVPFPTPVLADTSVRNIKIEPVDEIDQYDEEPYVYYVQVVTPDDTEFDDSPPAYYLRVAPNRGSSHPNAKFLELPTLYPQYDKPPFVYVRFKALNDEPEEPKNASPRPVILRISPNPPSSPSANRKPKRIKFPPNRSFNPGNPIRYVQTTLEPVRPHEAEGESVRFLPVSLQTLRDPSVDHIEVESVPEIPTTDTEPDVHYVKINKPDDEEFDDSPANYYLRVAPNRGYSKPNAKYLRLPPAGAAPNLYVKMEALGGEPYEPDETGDSTAVVEVKPASTFLEKKPKKIRFRPNIPEHNKPYIKSTLLLKPPYEPRIPSVRLLDLSNPIMQDPAVKYMKIERVPDVDEDDTEPGVHYVKVQTPEDEFPEHFTYLRLSPSTDDTQPKADYLPLPAARRTAAHPSHNRPPNMYVRMETADSPQEPRGSTRDQLVNESAESPNRNKKPTNDDELPFAILPLDSSMNRENPTSPYREVEGDEQLDAQGIPNRYPNAKLTGYSYAPIEPKNKNIDGAEESNVAHALYNAVYNALRREIGSDEQPDVNERRNRYPNAKISGYSYAPIEPKSENEARDEESHVQHAVLPSTKLPLDSSPNRENPISPHESPYRMVEGDEHLDAQGKPNRYPNAKLTGFSYAPIEPKNKNEEGDEESNMPHALHNAEYNALKREIGGDEQPDEKEKQNRYPSAKISGYSYAPNEPKNANKAGDEESNVPHAELPSTKSPLDSSPNPENPTPPHESPNREVGRDELDAQGKPSRHPNAKLSGYSYAPIEPQNRNEAGVDESNVPNALYNAVYNALRREIGGDEQQDINEKRPRYADAKLSGYSYMPIEPKNKSEAGDEESHVPHAELPSTKLPLDSSPNRDNLTSPHQSLKREVGSDEQLDAQGKSTRHPNAKLSGYSYAPNEPKNRNEDGVEESNGPNVLTLSREMGGDEQPDVKERRNKHPNAKISGYSYAPNEQTNENEAGDEESYVPHAVLPSTKLPLDSSPNRENLTSPHQSLNREVGGDEQLDAQGKSARYPNAKLSGYSYAPIEPQNRNEAGVRESNMPNALTFSREIGGDEQPDLKERRNGYPNAKISGSSYAPNELKNDNDAGDDESHVPHALYNAVYNALRREIGGDEQPHETVRRPRYANEELSGYSYAPIEPKNKNEAGDEESHVPHTVLPSTKLPLDSSPNRENSTPPHESHNREVGGDEQQDVLEKEARHPNAKLSGYSYAPIGTKKINEAGDEESSLPHAVNRKNPTSPHQSLEREVGGDEQQDALEKEARHPNAKLSGYSYAPIGTKKINEAGDEESSLPHAVNRENPTSPHKSLKREVGGDEQQDVLEKEARHPIAKLSGYSYAPIGTKKINEAGDEESSLPHAVNRENPTSPRQSLRREVVGDEQQDALEKEARHPNAKLSGYSYTPTGTKKINEAGDEESSLPHAVNRENHTSPHQSLKREVGGDEQQDVLEKEARHPIAKLSGYSYAPIGTKKINEAGDEESSLPHAVNRENPTSPHQSLKREVGGDEQQDALEKEARHPNAKLSGYSYAPTGTKKINEAGDEESSLPHAVNRENHTSPHQSLKREVGGDEQQDVLEKEARHPIAKLSGYSYAPTGTKKINEAGDEESSLPHAVNRENPTSPHQSLKREVGGDEQQDVLEKEARHPNAKLSGYSYAPIGTKKINETGDEESSLPHAPTSPHQSLKREVGGDEQQDVLEKEARHPNAKLSGYSYAPIGTKKINETGDEESSLPHAVNRENPTSPHQSLKREVGGDEQQDVLEKEARHPNAKLSGYSYAPIGTKKINEAGDEESSLPHAVNRENSTSPHKSLKREVGGDEQQDVLEKEARHPNAKLSGYSYAPTGTKKINEAGDEESSLPHAVNRENSTSPHQSLKREVEGDEQQDALEKDGRQPNAKLSGYSYAPTGTKKVNEADVEESSVPHAVNRENPTSPHQSLKREVGGDEQQDALEKEARHPNAKLSGYSYAPIGTKKINEAGDEESSLPHAVNRENSTSPHKSLKREVGGDEQQDALEKEARHPNAKLSGYSYAPTGTKKINEAGDEESSLPHAVNRENPTSPHQSLKREVGGDEQQDALEKDGRQPNAKLSGYSYAPTGTKKINEAGDEESSLPHVVNRENHTPPHQSLKREVGGDEQQDALGKEARHPNAKLSGYSYAPNGTKKINEAGDEESSLPHVVNRENPTSPYQSLKREVGGDEQQDALEKDGRQPNAKLSGYSYAPTGTKKINEAGDEESSLPHAVNRENHTSPHQSLNREMRGDEQQDVLEKEARHPNSKLSGYSYAPIGTKKINEAGDEESHVPHAVLPSTKLPNAVVPSTNYESLSRELGGDEEPDAEERRTKYPNGRPSRSVSTQVEVINTNVAGGAESDVPNVVLPSKLPLDSSLNRQNLQSHETFNREVGDDEQLHAQEKQIRLPREKPSGSSYDTIDRSKSNKAGDDESNTLKNRRPSRDQEPNDAAIAENTRISHRRKSARRKKVKKLKFLPKNPSDPQQLTRYIKASLQDSPHKEPRRANVNFLPFSSTVLEDPTIKNIKIEPVSDIDGDDDDPNVHYVRVQAPPEEEFDGNPKYQYLRVSPNRGPKLPNEQVLELPLKKNKPHSRDQKKKPAFYVRIETHNSEPEEADNNVILKVEPTSSSKKKPKRVIFPTNKSNDPDDASRYVNATVLSNLPREQRKDNVRYLPFSTKILDDPTVQNLKMEPVSTIDENDDEPNAHHVKIETPDDEDFENSAPTKYFKVSPNRGDSQPNAKLLSLGPVKKNRPQSADFYVRIETLGADPEDEPRDDVAILTVRPNQGTTKTKTNLKKPKRVRFPPNDSTNPQDPTRYIKATVQQQVDNKPNGDTIRYLTFPGTLLKDPTVHNIAIAPADADEKELYPEAKYLEVEKPDDEEFEESPVHTYFRVRPNRGNAGPNEEVLSLPKNHKDGTPPVFYVKMEALGAEPDQTEIADNKAAFLKVKPMRNEEIKLPNERTKSGQGEDDLFKNPTAATPNENLTANRPSNPSDYKEPEELNTTKTHPNEESTSSSTSGSHQSGGDTSTKSQEHSDEDSDEPAKRNRRHSRKTRKLKLEKIKFPPKKSKHLKNASRYLKATVLKRRGKEPTEDNLLFIPFAAKNLLNSGVENIQIAPVSDIKAEHKDPDAKYIKVQKPDDGEFDDSPKYYYLQVKPNNGEQQHNAKVLSLPLTELRKGRTKNVYVRLEALGAEPEEHEDGNVIFLKVDPNQSELPLGGTVKVIKFPPRQQDISKETQNASRFIKAVLQEGTGTELPNENEYEQYIPLPRHILEDPKIKFMKIEPVGKFDERETGKGVSYFNVETPRTSGYRTFKLSPLKENEQPNRHCLKLHPLKNSHQYPVFVKVQALGDDFEELPHPDYESVLLKVDADPAIVRRPPSNNRFSGERYLLVNLQQREDSGPAKPHIHYLPFTSPMIQDPTVDYIEISLVLSVNKNDKNSEALYLTVEMSELETGNASQRQLYFRIVPIRGKIQHRQSDTLYFSLRDVEPRPTTLLIRTETYEGELEESLRHNWNLIIIKLDDISTRSMKHAMRETRADESMYQFMLIKLTEQQDDSAPGVQYLPVSCEDFDCNEAVYLKIEAVPDIRSDSLQPGAHYVTIEIPEGAPVQQVHLKILPVKDEDESNEDDRHAKYIRFPMLKKRKRSNSITIYIRIELLAHAPEPAVSLNYKFIVLRLGEVSKTTENTRLKATATTSSPKRSSKKRRSKSSRKQNESSERMKRPDLENDALYHYLWVTLHRKTPDSSSQDGSLYAAIKSPLLKDAAVHEVKIETIDAINPKYYEANANFMSVKIPTGMDPDAPQRQLTFKIVPTKARDKQSDSLAKYLGWVENDESERTDTIYIHIKPLVDEPDAEDSNGMVIKL